MVAIGAAGSEGDSSIFQRSWMGEALLAGEMPVPPPETAVKFKLLGHSAFKESHFMRSPFTGLRETSLARITYNRRLCRARISIERAFGKNIIIKIPQYLN